MYKINKNDPTSWSQTFPYSWEAEEYTTTLLNYVNNVDAWVEVHSDAFSKRYVVKWDYK